MFLAHFNSMRPERSSPAPSGRVRNLSYLAVALSLLFIAPAARAGNTTYYISNNSCSNTSSGTSSSTPWCDFSRPNAMTFGPGDQILLASGGYWNTTLSPSGLGSTGVANHITIGCYNTASSCNTNYPTIAPPSGSAGVVLTNPSYWTITNLSLTGGAYGIHITFNKLGNQELLLQNLYLYNARAISGQVSILFDGYNSNPPGSMLTSSSNPAIPIPTGQYVISNVTMLNVNIKNAGPIWLIADYTNTQEINNGYPNAQQNITIKNLSADGFDNCFNFADITNMTITDASITNGNMDAQCGTKLYLVAATNVTFNNLVAANNTVTYMNGQDSVDNAVFVYDNQEQGVRWRGNYFYNNSNSAIEGSENPEFHYNSTSTNSNFEISSSSFANNSMLNQCIQKGNPYAVDGFYGDVSVSYSPQTTMLVQNNVYLDTPQTCNGFFIAGNPRYQTLTNNTAVGSSPIYNSQAQFSGTQNQNQWSYQYWNGFQWGSYTPTYSAASSAWVWPSGAFINAFDTQPDTCRTCWTAHFWTAPKAGTVRVTGWVLKNTIGTQVDVGVYHQGTNPGFVWGANGQWYTLGANDQVGVATNVQVAVQAGDTLQFVVGDRTGGDPSGAVVSWIPSVSYQ